jgi:hypothetical protein
VLQGVANFMGRHGDRRNRSAIEIFGRKAHCFFIGRVMVTAINALKLDGLKPGLVEQVPRQLAAGSRKPWLFDRVLGHHPLDPELRTKNESNEQGATNNEKNKHGAAPALIPEQC